MKLFIDSSSKYLYIDIIDKDEHYSFVRLGKNDHSEMLVTCLEEFLKEKNYTPNDIDEVYIGRGPGSYTGQRISGTFGKVFSFIKNVPLYSFSSLDYLLTSYLENDGTYLVHIDAKKNHSYLKVINVEDKNIKIILDETFSENTIFEQFPNAVMICPDDKEKNPSLLLKYKLYQEESNLDYTPNYFRSEFN